MRKTSDKHKDQVNIYCFHIELNQLIGLSLSYNQKEKKIYAWTRLKYVIHYDLLH